MVIFLNLPSMTIMIKSLPRFVEVEKKRDRFGTARRLDEFRIAKTLTWAEYWIVRGDLSGDGNQRPSEEDGLFFAYTVRNSSIILGKVSVGPCLPLAFAGREGRAALGMDSLAGASRTS